MTQMVSRPPDPSQAGTPGEFVESLGRLRRWAGEPSLSTLRTLGGQATAPDGTRVDALPKSTISHVLRQPDRLPRWSFVQAFVTACLRHCDHPAERIPIEVECWRAARAALAVPATPDPPAPAVRPEPPPMREAGAIATSHDDSAKRAVRLLARRVAREEDRTRKALLDGYSVAAVSFATPESPQTGGDLLSIGSFFSAIHPQRLLIVGEPGAGKTVLAVELTLQLVAPLIEPGHAHGEHPMVPVRLSAARWTAEPSFEDWVAGQLVRDFGLSARDAARLVADRRVLPVLDGLDELDPDRSGGPPAGAIGLLAQLNRYSHRSGREPGPVVVTCRASTYAQLAAARVTLEQATRIHLHDLTKDQISGYLHDRWPDTHPRAADRDSIMAALSGPAGAAVQAALTTPWRMLLATAAIQAGASPTELLRAGAEQDTPAALAGINRRLLDAYVPAAIRLAPKATRYEPGQVQRWLQRIAAHLRWQDGHAARANRPPPGLTAVDIVPHLLWPIGGRKVVRVLHGVLSAILAVIAMWAFWTGSALDQLTHPGRNGPGPELGLTLALMTGWVAIATILATRPWPSASGGRAGVPLRRRLIGAALGALAGAAIGVPGGLFGLTLTEGKAFDTAFAITAGLAGGVALCGVLGATAAGRAGDKHLPIWPEVRADPAVVLGFGLCGALVGLPPLFLAHAGPVALLLGACGTFVLALSLGTAFKVATGGWSKDAELTHPREALRRNPSIGVAFGLTGGVAAFLVFIMRQDILTALTCALIGAVTFGLAFGATAWCRSVIGLLVAAWRGTLPLRLWTFLEWACQARLLRVSGATYQFRHRELQDFLSRPEDLRQSADP